METVAEILTKTAAWHDRRRQTLGGSDANILMSGDADAILQLWREKRGEAEPVDLSDVLPVQMGVWTEPFNMYWFEMTQGRAVTEEGVHHTHPEYGFMACTLDGLTLTEAREPAVFEAKHVNAFAKIDEVAQKYMPQLHHNMAVTGLRHAILSVFIGTLKHEVVEVECDDWYLAQLIDRERAFWACVESGEMPTGCEPIAPPEAPASFRAVDMTGSNEWASSALDWTANKDAAKTFEKAAKELKAMVEPDVGHAHGHGVEVKRAKNGSLRISEMKETKNGS